MKYVTFTLFIINVLYTIQIYKYRAQLKKYQGRLENEARMLEASYDSLKKEYQSYVVHMSETYSAMAPASANRWNEFDDFFLNKWSKGC